MKPKSREKYGWYRRFRVYLLALISIAVLLRIVFIYQLSISDFSDFTSLDSKYYVQLAKNMLLGKPLATTVLTFNPLYPLFLFVIFRLFDTSYLVVRIVQAVFGIVSIWLIYRCSLKIFSMEKWSHVKPELGALFASFIAIFYPNFLFYEGMLLATSIIILLVLTILFIALKIDGALSMVGDGIEKGSKVKTGVYIYLVSAGLLTAVGALARPNIFLILLVAFSAWLIFKARIRSTKLLVSYLVPALLILAIPLGFNMSKGGGFVPITAHGGINFYIGNGPSANGLFNPPMEIRSDMRGGIEDARIIAERKTGKSLKHSEVSRYWFRETLKYITSKPARWIRLMGRKVYYYFNGTEVPDVADISIYIDSCRVLRFLFFPFSLISALSVPGLILMALRWRRYSIFLLFFAVLSFATVIFYIHTRYRLPSIPLFIISASYFILWFFETAAEKKHLKAFVFFALALVLFIFVGISKPIAIDWSALYNSIGNFYMDKGERGKANMAFEKAYRLNPNSLETKINYARVLRRLGKKEESMKLYSQAFSMRPDFPNLAIEYGSILEEMKYVESARKIYLYAYENGSRREKVFACKLLSRLSYSLGNRDEAIKWVRRALELVPGDPDLVELLNRLEER